MFKKKAIVPLNSNTFVPLSVMNAAFERKAGHYCEVCVQHGSHFTDEHDCFASIALSLAAKNGIYEG